MTTEAVEANAGTDKTQAAAQGAQSGEEKTLAQLLSEGQTAQTKTEPEKKPDTAAATSTAAKMDDGEVAARVTREVTARLESKKQFDGLVKGLTDTAGIDSDMAEAMLERDLTKNPGMRDAWLNQFVNPGHWKQVAAAWQKETAAKFGGIKTKAKAEVSDRGLIRAGANLSPSADAPPEKRPSLRDDPKARGEFLRKYGFTHG